MAGKRGKVHRYLDVSFWAERGMISVLDEKDAADGKSAEKAFKRMRPGEFMVNAFAVYKMTLDKYPSQRRMAERLVEDAQAATKLAKSQGDPLDPEVQAYYARHRRRSSIMLPSDVNGGLGPIGGKKGWKFDSEQDRRDILLNGARVVPDLVIPQQQMLTPARAERLRKPKAAGRR